MEKDRVLTEVDWNMLMGYNRLWTSYESNSDGTVSCIGHMVSYGRDGTVLSQSHEPISTYSRDDVAIVASIGGLK